MELCILVVGTKAFINNRRKLFRQRHSRRFFIFNLVINLLNYGKTGYWSTGYQSSFRPRSRKEMGIPYMMSVPRNLAHESSKNGKQKCPIRERARDLVCVIPGAPKLLLVGELQQNRFSNSQVSNIITRLVPASLT